jgi:hypothetical protein
VQPSPEVRQTILRFYRALAVGDANAIAALVSREAGVLVIGTDPDEWWNDYECSGRR